MDHLFVAESIGVSFSGKPILKSASVWVDPGRISVMLGRNGCGKSTLIRAALGLVSKDFGVVSFGSKVFVNPRLHRLASLGLFYLPDKGLLSRRRTLGWQLALTRKRFPQRSNPSPLPGLDTESLLNKTTWDMSGGEARRAELALAWARGPSCLLADEPLAGLAPKDQEVVVGVLRAMAEKGCGILITGHDAGHLLELADQVVWMAAGTTHGLGSPQSARKHHQFRKEYLGPGPGFFSSHP